MQAAADRLVSLTQQAANWRRTFIDFCLVLFLAIDLIFDLPSYQQQRKGSAYTQATSSSSSWERHGQGARVRRSRRRRSRSSSSSSSSSRIERASRRSFYTMMSEPSSRGGGLSMSAASSPSMAGTSVPSKRRSKASPSDVIFGQPPGSDEAVHSLGPLSTDSSPSSRPTSSRKRPHPRTSSPASAPPSTSPRAARGPPPREAETVAGAASRAAPGDVVDGVKTLPYRLDDASTEDILVLVGDMLLRLMTHNDSLPLHPSSLTRFHSRATPGISIQSYLRRISKYTSLDKACLLILLVYIDRVCERVKGFTICSLTVHRFVCAAVVCATKALCDAFSTNGHYARVGGISLVELNMLEKEFLSIIDWHLTCSGALLQHYYASLVSSHPSYALEEGRGEVGEGEAGPSSSSSSSSSSGESEAGGEEAVVEGEGEMTTNGDTVKPSAGALAEEPYLTRKHSHRHHHHHRRDNGDAAPALEADRVAQQRANAGSDAAMEE